MQSSHSLQTGFKNPEVILVFYKTLPFLGYSKCLLSEIFEIPCPLRNRRVLIFNVGFSLVYSHTLSQTSQWVSNVVQIADPIA